MKKVKALVLLSGGLDSMLAAKVLMEQGIEVTALTFVSNFFNANQSRISAKNIGVDLIEYDFKSDHLRMVKNPKNGYGKNMNPCVDCHGLMVKTAYKVMKEKGFDFIATGEVLGQRPKSQNKIALNLVEKYGELDGRLLRPLSAKLLPETKMEKLGLVDRSKLYEIEGRNREKQIELANKYRIEEYPAPGGGCILTYAEYSKKLKRMFEIWPNCNNNDIDLLRAGRNIWINEVLIVAGRFKEDNDKIEELAQKGDMIFSLTEHTGPLVLLRDKNKTKFKKFDIIKIEVPSEIEIKYDEKDFEKIVEIATTMTGYFSPKLRGKKVGVKLEIK